MVQQAVNLALNIQDHLKDNWSLKDELAKDKFTWWSFEPTRKEVRETSMAIVVAYQSGTGEPKSLAVSQMSDVVKIDIWQSIRNGEGEDERLKSEELRMIIKNEILKIIHDDQIAIPGIKFGNYSRSARSDETEDGDKQWYLHEILFIQASWYHTES